MGEPEHAVEECPDQRSELIACASVGLERTSALFDRHLRRERPLLKLNMEINQLVDPSCPQDQR